MKINENYISVTNRLNISLAKSSNNNRKINMIAVSKRQSYSSIKELLDLGHLCFGENQVKEALDKWENLKRNNRQIQLHLIGPLQTNKVKQAVSLFDCIQTVDREKLAIKIADEIKITQKNISCFIQVNTGMEDQKGGVSPSDVDTFIKFCIEKCNLNVEGLMCLPPREDDPALHFAMLNVIAKRNRLKYLSMGMSKDYEIGVRFGATHVRIGEGIFGKRE